MKNFSKCPETMITQQEFVPSKHYEVIGTGLIKQTITTNPQEIDFREKLEENGVGATMFFITEE